MFKNPDSTLKTMRIHYNQQPLRNTEHFIAVPLRTYRGADKSLARPGRKHATATEDFEFHIVYL